MQLSLSVVVWCAVGGRQSLLGAMLGAIIVAGTQGALSESEAFLDTWTLIMGALFVLVVLLLPNGLASLPDLIRYQWAKASVKRNQAAAKPKAQAPTTAAETVVRRRLVRRIVAPRHGPGSVFTATVAVPDP